MKAIGALIRGLSASLALPALGALGWAYAACLAVAAAFTLLAYRFVSTTVAGSAMAADLRHGQTIGWIVDLAGTPGTTSSVAMLATAAIVLAAVYLALTIFLSGGIVTRVRAALGFGAAEPFLTASARHVGAMARVASVEIVVVGVLVVVMLVGEAVGAYGSFGNAVAWGWLALSLFVLALVTSVFDYARIRLVEREDGSAMRALGEAIRFVGRNAAAVALLAALAGVVALAVWWLVVWLHGVVALDTGIGVLLGLVVGQVGVLARLWTRIAAYAAETALFETE
jgi:hypothetical protein